jgi:hypothetical protein
LVLRFAVKRNSKSVAIALREVLHCFSTFATTSKTSLEPDGCPFDSDFIHKDDTFLYTHER